jgi:hypothetical protein
LHPVRADADLLSFLIPEAALQVRHLSFQALELGVGAFFVLALPRHMLPFLFARIQAVSPGILLFALLR